MTRRDVPEPWASAMIKRGWTPSFRELARRAGSSPETVRQLTLGTRAPSEDTIAKVADALLVDVRTIAAWVGAGREVAEPYVAPAEANRLSTRQRAAIDELIRVMAEPRVEAAGEEEFMLALLERLAADGTSYSLDERLAALKEAGKILQRSRSLSPEGRVFIADVIAMLRETLQHHEAG